MKIYHKLIFGLLCCGAAVACDKDVLDINSDPFKDQTYTNALMSPISTFLTEQEGYGEYVKALRYSGMFDALNQSSSGVSFTAFVPNDDAMQAFYKRRLVDSLKQLPVDYVRQFVLYHTVKDSILPDAFVLKKSIQNLSGDNIDIEIDSLHAGEATLNGEGRVVEMGLSAYNGKVYVLSSAMTPLVETVYDRIVQGGTSHIMVEALQATGWDKKLSLIVDTTLNQDRQRVITHYYYTLLNVSDATFAKSGIGSLDQLKSKLSAADQQGLSTDSLLREYVGYHILTNQYSTAELGAMNGSEVTRIWSSSAMNQVFTVTYDSLATEEAQKYTLNANDQAARFVPASSNVLSKNGYVHELDGWLPVWEPEQTTVLWDLADYTEIKNLVDAENYQPAEPATSEKRTRVANAACFEYEMGESGSKNNSYSDIDYVTCTNKFSANNNDRIVFNLGYMGSASMQTPTIVRGKYRVEVDFVYTSSQSFMRTQSDGNGGMMKIMFDDNDDLKVFKAPYTTVSSIMQGVYSATLFDEVDFPETASHKFSFTILDPAASTNKGFSLQLDCIKFIPIKN
jgi:uncharacterized surface protein with fasciclin (FAS1) repeats